VPNDQLALEDQRLQIPLSLTQGFYSASNAHIHTKIIQFGIKRRKLMFAHIRRRAHFPISILNAEPVG
jgi:hypothetical protein